MRKLLRAVPLCLLVLCSTSDAFAIKWPFGGGNDKARRAAAQPRPSSAEVQALTQARFLARHPASATQALEQVRPLVGNPATSNLACAAGLCAVTTLVQHDLGALKSPHTAPAVRAEAKARVQSLSDPGILGQYIGSQQAQDVARGAQLVAAKIQQTQRAVQPRPGKPRPGDELKLLLGEALTFE